MGCVLLRGGDLRCMGDPPSVESLFYLVTPSHVPSTARGITPPPSTEVGNPSDSG